MDSRRPRDRRGREPDVGPRRQAREAALQVLYGLDAADRWERDDVEEALRAYWEHFEAPAPGRSYGDQIVRGVAVERAAIDAAIRRAQTNWRLERMARVDRNILRLAAWEIAHTSEVPAQVAINEAVELSKTYGSEDSAAFVNGSLDKLATQAGRLVK